MALCDHLMSRGTGPHVWPMAPFNLIMDCLAALILALMCVWKFSLESMKTPRYVRPEL